MAAAHRQARDGAAVGLCDGPVLLVDERDDLLHEAVHVGVLPLGILTVHLDGLEAEGVRGLLVRVAVRHHHDHRLREALLDEVVQDLGGAAHRGPGFLVTAAAVEEVEDGILGLGVLLVAVRGVHGHTAGDAQERAVIPAVGHGTVVLGLIIVLGALAGDEQHVQVAGAVALDLVVQRVVDGDAVHDEVVGVDFRFRGVDGDFPDTAFTLGHVDGARPWVLHPVAGELDAGGIVGAEAEGDLAVFHLGRDDAGTAAAHGEVGEFLPEEGGHREESGSEKGEDSFHGSVLLLVRTKVRIHFHGLCFLCLKCCMFVQSCLNKR